MELNTALRTIEGKKVKRLRLQGIIPLGLYGKEGVKNLQTSLDRFRRAYQEAGESTLVDLKIEGKGSEKVLLDKPQYHPVTGEPIHATLRQVDLAQKIKTRVPLEFTGEPEVVKNGVGILLTLIDEIEIECLPGDLLSVITVDTAQLKEVGDTIVIGDLKVDREKLAIELAEDEPVAKIDFAQMEEEKEEEEAVSEEEAVAKVEATEEKKEEEGETKEKAKDTTA
ncbi:MAG: 50S ribosomal protein L25 [bacterium]